jgi:hypothetical protein
MNYCWFIVRIIKNPIQTYFKQNISVMEIIGEFRQKSSVVKSLKILFWSDNKNTDNILKFCKINDYIVVSGQILIIKNREIEISVTKIIPVFSSRVNSTK